MYEPVPKRWKISCMTFNVNARKAVATSVYKLLDEEEFNTADVVVIGLQEVSHSELFVNAFVDTSWVTIISSWMYLSRKALLYKTFLATNILLIFARLETFVIVEKIDVRSSRMTFKGLTGHKGSVSVRIKLKNGDGIVFINSHMVPHPDGYVKRCLQFDNSRICTFEDDEAPSTSYSTIWLGDMNWRVDSISPLEMEARLKEIKTDTEIEALVNNLDQLRRARRRQEAFVDYVEEPIFFNPTYRLLVGTRDYDFVRVPSWCDRILYKGLSLHCEAYRSNQNVTLSDHFPVIAIFSYELSSNAFAWAVTFENMPQWSSAVPVFCHFTFHESFWDVDGSYRDWIGVFPEEVTDSKAPKEWLYLFSCYKMNETDGSPLVGEFPCIPPGRYRFGYYSLKRSALQGLSAPFVVV